jgi:hypothetical protein
MKTWERIRNWELWPFALRYLFITPAWLWYCLRSGSLWFFSSSDPTITFGGFEGEGKKEMYELLPTELYPKTIYIQPGEPFDTVRKKVAEKGFGYPFCVKPDVGMKGLLFRKIDNEEQLQLYHSKVPLEYIIQDFVQYPLEVSVFYYRYPWKKKGVITGFIQKDLMEVVGDGVSTLSDLIIQHPKARFRMEEMQIKHAAYFDKILAKGERFPLAHAANLNRGATFTNLHDQIDDQLLSVFDALSFPTQFYYGRYDIKCNSIAELKEGKNFSILEFNGSGAEPNHVYHSGYSLFQAQKVFLRHWKVLYEISRYNHQNKVKTYWPFGEGMRFLRDAKKHLKVLEKYDKEILI